MDLGACAEEADRFCNGPGEKHKAGGKSRCYRQAKGSRGCGVAHSPAETLAKPFPSPFFLILPKWRMKSPTSQKRTWGKAIPKPHQALCTLEGVWASFEVKNSADGRGEEDLMHLQPWRLQPYLGGAGSAPRQRRQGCCGATGCSPQHLQRRNHVSGAAQPRSPSCRAAAQPLPISVLLSGE